MNASSKLQAVGQSIWLDNITRDMLNDGGLERYIREYAVTGLTSNPSIFQKALAQGQAYDADIDAADPALSDEDLFNRLALTDLKRAAHLLAPAHADSRGMDGWVSLEVSPLLAHDAETTVQAARQLHEQAQCENLFIKIPSTEAGVQAIEEATFAGIPVNVTLLFSCKQTLACAQAWMRGIERRLQAGKSPRVHSVLSLFISRWDVAVQDQLPASLHNKLGIAMAAHTWHALQELQSSPRWKSLINSGAPAQRMLWASTGTKDPSASDVLYVEALALPGTINTMPEATLLAFADHGRSDQAIRPDENGQVVLTQIEQAGIDIEALALQLQQEGAAAFVKSWHELLQGLAAKRAR